MPSSTTTTDVYEDRDILIEGKEYTERDILIEGFQDVTYDRGISIMGFLDRSIERSILINGKHLIDREIVIDGKNTKNIGICINGQTPPVEFIRRFTVLDFLNLRYSNVYESVSYLVPLQIPYGDLSTSRIPCLALDTNGYEWFIGDCPIHSVSAVYVNNQQVSGGYKIFPAYTDTTGRTISKLKFDLPRYNNSVSVSLKGKVNESGDLIENPADFIQDLLLNIQEYDEDAIDRTNLNILRSECYRHSINIAVVLNQHITLKELFDDVSINIWANWLISDGKTIVRLKGLD